MVDYVSRANKRGQSKCQFECLRKINRYTIYIHYSRLYTSGLVYPFSESHVGGDVCI